MRNFLLLVFIGAWLAAPAQEKHPLISKKAQQIYARALDAARDGNMPEAANLMEGAIKAAPNYTDAYLSLAGMYGEMKNYDKAITNYEKIKNQDPAYFEEYNLPYSINLAGKGRFKEALVAVNEFLKIPDLNQTSRKSGEYRKGCFEFALAFEEGQTSAGYTFEPKNMGDGINSPVSEYFPTVTIDGKEFVFTRRVNNRNEDFYGARLDSNGWASAKPLEGNINTPRNEGAQNISQDGKWMIFTGCNFPNGYGSCDLYISYLTEQGWSTPENMGPLINTPSWESAPSLSPDKQDLYFVSSRPGGLGGSDIYVSHRLPNGRWGVPENLGPPVNTSGDESHPFIHADNQSLYFTSTGHTGYGGSDLFVTRKGPRGSWSNAQNLGYPINTIEDEGSLVVTADGVTAYYASDRSDSRGGLDLYTFELRKDIRPVKTLWVKGKVFDKNTREGLPTSVELTDLLTKAVTSKVQTDETGNYLITLPVGRDYAFNVNRKGYLFYSENFPLSRESADSTYAINIPLQPLAANATVVLKNLFFDINESVIKTESQVELNNIVRLLTENPTLRIRINGHTDNVGQAADNLKLSNDRAKAVIEYLTSHGIDKGRLSAQGFGATQPVATNDTEEGRAQNRRTELKIISE